MRRAGARADEKNMITVSFVDGSNHSEGISVPRIGAAADLTTRSCSSLLDDDEALPTWSGMAHPSSGTVQNVNADCIMYSLPNPSHPVLCILTLGTKFFDGCAEFQPNRYILRLVNGQDYSNVPSLSFERKR